MSVQHQAPPKKMRQSYLHPIRMVGQPLGQYLIDMSDCAVRKAHKNRLPHLVHIGFDVRIEIEMAAVVGNVVVCYA